MSREKIKSLILLVLVILSFMLTQRIWFDSSLSILQSEASNEKERQHHIKSVRNDLISPQQIILAFGGDSFGSGSRNNDYTVLNDQEMKVAWQEAKNLLLDFFTGESDIKISTYEKYLQNSQGAKFVELEFGDNIPSVLVSTVFDAYDSNIVRNIREIKKILIPARNKGTIFILGKDDHVYEVTLPDYENKNLEAFIDEYNNEKSFVRYYTLFSNSVNNLTPMPLNYNRSIPQYFVESEIDVKNEQAIIERTKKFFNGNLDFVKTIRETSGAVVYLYGYGERSVRINSRGRLEYNAEVGSVSSNNVLESLDVAVNFVLDQGGFPEGAYLKEIRQLDKSYYFGFGYDLEGYPLVFTGNNMKHPIEVEVYGNSVKSYRRFVRKKMSLAPVYASEGILIPPRIIERNIDLFKEHYLQDHPKEANLIEDNEILEKIEALRLVYFDKTEEVKIQSLIPCWTFEINGRVYYFDSYSGKLLHSSRLN